METEKGAMHVTDQDIALLLKRLPIAASELRAIVAERKLTELQSQMDLNGNAPPLPNAQG